MWPANSFSIGDIDDLDKLKSISVWKPHNIIQQNLIAS